MEIINNRPIMVFKKDNKYNIGISKKKKYGGVGCHECGYEGNDIVCKGCYSDYNLGKTYSYDYYFDLNISRKIFLL